MKTSYKLVPGLSLISLCSACAWLPATVNSQEAVEKPKTEIEAPLLHWAPPQLEKPITIQIGQGYTSKNLKADRDYIIKLPAEKQVGGVALKGGRNIVMIGGYITVPPGAANQSQQRAIYIKDSKGTVHIEGVKIDNWDGSEFDGIAVAAPDAIIQIQNCRITELTGSQKTLHADILQPWGGAKEIRIDRLTGTSDYQGFQIPPDNALIGRAELRNINLGHILPPKGRPGFLLWLTKGTKTCDTYPMVLENFYVEARKGETVGQSVWPPVGATVDGCAAIEKDNAVSWPNLPVKGFVKLGPPPEGDFVPENIAGVTYVSPGYVAPKPGVPRLMSVE
jgi:hypothetical protein